MPFGFPDTFTAKPLVTAPVRWQDDADKKRLFGLELAKNNKNAFECACLIFGKDTSKALWASINWPNDQIVIDARVNGEEKVETPSLLDKTQLCVKLLSFADERVIFNGNSVFAAEAKDRLKALELYAKIQGMIDKVDINNNNNFITNEMKITFVEPEKKEEIKTIENIIEKEEELLPSPIKLKLVG